MATRKDFSVPLDFIGQLPNLNMYTQLCFCFSLAETISHEPIIDNIRNALVRLSANVPWIAGQVVTEDSDEFNSGVFKIKPLHDVPTFVVKDLRDIRNMPSMDSMGRAGFPFTMLDEAVIAPRNTVQDSHTGSGTEAIPVFLLQASIINGGLLLTFLGQHQVMDMTGQAQIIHLLSKACRGEDFTAEEISIGNRSRQNLVPLLDGSYQPGPELDDQIVKPSSPPKLSDGTFPSLGAPSPKNACAYFTFSRASLAALKALATASLPPSSAYITTDDALTAFVWQSVSRVRLHRLGPAVTTALARAVDVRQIFGLPQTYPGIIHNMTYHRHSLQELVEEPLGVIASKLRSAIDPETSQLEHNTRALATLLHRLPNKNSVSFLARFGPSSDMMISSWARENCYSFDFGVGLGRAEAIRRPRFGPNITLIYFMPRSLDGEIAVGMFMGQEDLERLREDNGFMEYAVYVG